jgi:hypothetical protein
MKGLLLMTALLWLGRLSAGAQNILLEATSIHGTTILQELAAPYFKTVPYNKSFSAFLQEVINDPELQDKKVSRRTDTTFFYVSGVYQRYNPFLYRPTKVKLIIAESEFTYSDTSQYRDTVVYYQMVVTTDTTEKAKQFVQKEYNRLLRKAGRSFTHQTYGLGQNNSAEEGEITNSFIAPFAVSPLTFAWGRETTTHEYAFSLSFRMKVNENRAGMVTLPQEPIRVGQ